MSQPSPPLRKGGADRPEPRVLGQFGVFLGGSALGALVDYAATLGAVRLMGAEPAIALGCAMTISATMTFFFHDRITFRGAARGRVRRYALFMGWSAVVFALRAVLLRIFLRLGLPLAAALLVAIGIASAVNFAMSRALIFAKPRP